MDLNLSGWIDRRKRDVGPYAEHIIKGVSAYEIRIEQLERELALERHKLTESEKVWMTTAQSAHDQLAAEKALADRLWVALGYFGALRNGDFEKSDIAAAYRKARGL